MKCTRCQGLMVTDHLLDMQESYVPMWMRGLRCIACGNIVDPLINRHRMIQKSGAGQLSKPGLRVTAVPRPAKAA
ncbi:MAG: hypothetical protein ACT4OL_08625 [Nitrospiraceae bacterium]